MANEMMWSDYGKKFLKEFLEKWGTIGAQMLGEKSAPSIKDEDITEMYKNLKNAHSVEDIMWMNE